MSLTIHCAVIVLPVDFLELMTSAFDIIVEEEDILLNKWENNMTITMVLRPVGKNFQMGVRRLASRIAHLA